MKEFLETAITFFSELTWKRLRGILILFGVLGVVLILIDGYTSYFTLSRLRRSAELISQVQTIDASKIKQTPELEAAYKTLCKQVSEAVAVRPWTLRLGAPHIQIPASRFWKFIASAIPWFLLSIIMLPDVFRRKPNSMPGLFAFYFMAAFFGVVGLLIPIFWWPWGNLIIVPFLLPFLLLVPIAYVGYKNAKKQKLQNAQD